MRYYRIEISDGPVWTSFVNGQTQRGAQDIELDIPVAPYANPQGGAFARVYGISLQQISQAADLNNKGIKIYGGMQKGLPLANPKQSGLLVQGTIFQCFGNWIGTDMTLDMMIVPKYGSTPDTTSNIVHSWPKGSKLSSAIQNALATAFPGAELKININDRLVLSEPDTGIYGSLNEYADYLKKVSQAIIGGDKYPGVQIVQAGAIITVFDGSTQSATKQIDFKDLIGQPTWIGFNEIQVKTVMRADISIGDLLKLPVTAVTTTSQSASQFRNKSAFQGTFITMQEKHYGRFRQPDAASWNTTLNLAVQNTAQG